MLGLATLLWICCSSVLCNRETVDELYLQEEYFVESAMMDPLKEDDHEEPDLTDIIRHSRTSLECQGVGCPDLDIDVYTDEQRQQAVDHHNVYRSNMTYPIPMGANVKYMEYNRTLEWAAALYLRHCIFDHGRHELDNMSTVQGQNLYFGPSKIVSRPIYLWYMEYPDYTFENGSCRSELGKYIPCGHLTQLLWSSTQVVGCALRSHCYPRSPAVLMSCHYHPQGNRHHDYHIPMYSFGVPCSRCELDDGNLCHKNLCVDRRMIQSHDLDHTCELDCQNCGVPDRERCRCDCKGGWDSNDCSVPCTDRQFSPFDASKGLTCKYVTGHFAKYTCSYSDITPYQCRKHCGYCRGVEGEKNELCCGGKTCDLHSVLDTDSCECRRDCPTYGCIYDVKRKTEGVVNSTVEDEKDNSTVEDEKGNSTVEDENDNSTVEDEKGNSTSSAGSIAKEDSGAPFSTLLGLLKSVCLAIFFYANTY